MTSIFRSIVHSSFRRSIQIGSFVQQTLNNIWVFLTSVADFTFTRAGDQFGINSSGVLVKSTANVAAFIDGEGVLLEGARTNLLLRSEELDNAAWSEVNGAIVTPNAETAPDGTMTADTIDNTAATNAIVRQSINKADTGEVITKVVFVKKGSSNVYRLRWVSATGGTAQDIQALFDFTTKAFTANAHESATIKELGNGWFKLSCTNTRNNTGNTQLRFDVAPHSANQGTVHAWGLGIAAASFPSSYTPTTSAADTRSATSMTRDWPFPANGITAQIKPTVNFDEADDKGSDVILLEFSDGTADNYLRVTFDQTNDQIHLTKKVSGGAEVVASTIATNLNYTDGDQLNIRFRANDTDGISLEVDGETRVDVATGDAKTDWSTLMDQIELHPAFVAVESHLVWNESKSNSFINALT